MKKLELIVVFVCLSSLNIAEINADDKNLSAQINTTCKHNETCQEVKELDCDSDDYCQDKVSSLMHCYNNKCRPISGPKAVVQLHKIYHGTLDFIIATGNSFLLCFFLIYFIFFCSLIIFAIFFVCYLIFLGIRKRIHASRSYSRLSQIESSDL